jgi:hypothetical protein
MTQPAVQIYGASATVRELRKFDKEAATEIRKGLQNAAEPIKSRAQGMVPGVALSQWSRYGWSKGDWSQGAVRKGIAVSLSGRRSRGSGTTAFVAIVNRNAAGAIFELAGRLGNNRLDRGLQASGHGAASRLIWRAFDEMNGDSRVESEVQRVMTIAQAKLQAALNRAGGAG